MKPMQQDGLLVRKLGDEFLLYDAKGKNIHILNETAHMIWLLCDGTNTPAEISNTVRAFFQPSPEADINQDVAMILEEFDSLGLLAEASQPASH